MVVNAISWTVSGLIAGCMASKLMNKRGKRLLLDILLGVAGAVISGWGFNAAGITGVTGFNVWSLVVAVVGAVVLLAAWRLMVGVVGGAVVVLVAWDAIRRSDSQARGSRNRKGPI
jgi:uncharacterized membrane protein YeaQ/YmgE (transglycosylase-associated protein family)